MYYCTYSAARRILELPLAAPCGSMNSETPRKAQEAALANQASHIYNESTTSEENVMANQEHLALLQQSIDTWNTWRKEHQDIQPDFSEADLSYADLNLADLRYADLRYADLHHADLRYADLSYANLHGVDLHDADLRDIENH